jgi:PKD repeat protein
MTYQWDFGDGQSSDLENPVHEYTAPGSYEVVLTATNTAGNDPFTQTIIIYSPPSAGFIAQPTQGLLPLLVAFTDTTTTIPVGDPTLIYSYNFGDGEISNLPNPEHMYTDTGIYTVSLTVSNTAGTDTLTRTDYISVYEPVIANFSGTPTSGSAPLSVDFTNLSMGDYDICNWDFGDGAISSDCDDPSHVYSESGVYTVTLIVSGLGGVDTQIRNDYIQVVEEYSIYLPIALR